MLTADATEIGSGIRLFSEPKKVERPSLLRQECHGGKSGLTFRWTPAADLSIEKTHRSAERWVFKSDCRLPAVAVSATVTAAPTAAATATIAAATTAATATARAFFTRTGFVHGEWTTLKIFLVKHLDRFGRVFLRTHFHEGEPARPASGAVLHDVDGDHRTRLGEVILEVVFCRCEGQISDEEFRGHMIFLCL